LKALEKSPETKTPPQKTRKTNRNVFFSEEMLRYRLVHVLASDAHSPETRLMRGPWFWTCLPESWRARIAIAEPLRPNKTRSFSL
jgi:hypothetical protein